MNFRCSSRISIQPWIITKADPKRRYGRASTGVNLYTIKSYYWQNVLDSILQKEADSPNSFNVPVDVHNRFINHLNAEVRRMKVDKKGNQVEVWEKAHRMKKNDLRDATIYSIVAGHLDRLHEISNHNPEETSQFRKLKQPTKQNRSIAERRRMGRGRR